MPLGNFSTNLGLPATPLADDPELFGHLVPIYRAIQGLQAALDQYTGILPLPEDAWSTIPPQDTLLAGNLFRAYRQFAVAVLGGQMVTINAAGQVALASSTVANSMCRGYSTGNVAAGAFGEIITFGGTLTFAPATLTPGATYWLGSTLGTIAPGPSGAAQIIGWAITDSILVFQPNAA